MGEQINKVIFKGRISVKANQVTRYPSGGRLPQPWTGFFYHNLSKNYLYMDWDAEASESTGFPIYDWDRFDFDDFAIKDYISFYGASAATVYLMGYAKVDLKYISPESIVGGEAAPFSEHPIVSDPDFHKKRKVIEDLVLGPDYDIEDYLGGRQ